MLTAAQQMDERDNRRLYDPAQSLIELEHRWMDQLILHNHSKLPALHAAQQTVRTIVHQTPPIGTPWQRDDGHLMPALLQMLHQLAVVQKAARDLVETPIDDQCNMHGARLF